MRILKVRRSVRFKLLINVVFLLVCSNFASIAQIDHSSRYSFSFGFSYNTELTNFNEQLLNSGDGTLSPYATNLSLASDHSFNRFSLQVNADLAIVQNKPNPSRPTITLSQSNFSMSGGYNLLKSNHFRLQPAFGVGVAFSSMKFEYQDTATSVNSILAGNTTSTNIQTKATLLFTPKLQFYFKINQADSEGFLVETGYYFAPKRLEWSVTEVSQTRIAGFYFRLGFFFPNRS